MKNNIVIDLDNGASCELLTNINDGSNRILIELITAAESVAVTVAKGSESTSFTTKSFEIPPEYINTAGTITITANGTTAATITTVDIPTGFNMNLSNQGEASYLCVVKEQATTFPLSIEKGGTGATTVAAALENLGAAAKIHEHSAADITSGILPVANGGTGATTANAAATNLYESGTWTPKLICEGSGAVNPTYTHSYNGTAGSPIGRYTRIGNLVYVQCYIPALISAAGTGSAAISGLPYAGRGGIDSTLVNRGYINALNGSVSTLNPVLKVSHGGTTAGYRVPDGSGAYNWKVNTSTSPKGSLIQFAGVYRIG